MSPAASDPAQTPTRSPGTAFVSAASTVRVNSAKWRRKPGSDVLVAWRTLFVYQSQ